MRPGSDCNIGDVVEWGRYPYGADGEVRPIEWVIIGRSPEGLLALAKYGLDMRRYHSKEQDITWEKCELRQWLNGEFLRQAFNEDEREELKLTEVYNDENLEYETPAGEDTEDKVFLLSADEFEEFCDDEEWTVCWPTPYAVKRGVEVLPEEEVAGCWWWLRTPGSEEDFALEVGAYGEVGDQGTPVQWLGGAVRPAIQFKI